MQHHFVHILQKQKATTVSEMKIVVGAVVLEKMLKISYILNLTVAKHSA